MERKILSLVGEEIRQFESIIGWKGLQADIDHLGIENPLTKLVPNLYDVHPGIQYLMIR